MRRAERLDSVPDIPARRKMKYGTGFDLPPPRGDSRNRTPRLLYT